MGNRQEEIIEFYRQLALLTQSGLPLPESVRDLAGDCQNRRLQGILTAIADDLGKGRPLSEALAPYESSFPPFHRRIIAAGERAGTLPHVLHEVSRFAQFTHSLTATVRELGAYPAFTLAFGVAVFLAVFRFVMPSIGTMSVELLDGPLNHASWFLIQISGMISSFWGTVVAVYVMSVALGIWLFSGHSSSDQPLRSAMGALPYCKRIFHWADASRLCGILAILLRRQLPLGEALEIASEVSLGKDISQELLDVRDLVAKGMDVDDILADRSQLPDALRTCLSHTPAGLLPDELENLRTLYEDRVRTSARYAAMFWQAGGLVGMGIVAGGIIIAMFLPLIQLYGRLAEGAP